MLYMNDYDLAYAVRRFGAAGTQNRLEVALLVERLRKWTNANSAGWAYWPAPVRAARTAMGLIHSTTSALNDAQEREDATEAVVKRALSPVKAFCTRAVRAGIMTEADRLAILGRFA